ncbi:MAG TPA: nitroreductase family protein [Gaiellaceae bacterium]
MDTYQAVASKRDWRRYAERAIPDEVVGRVLDAGRLAGSAVNRQPWRFIVVEDASRREALAESVYTADNVRGAALVVAIATPEGKSPLDVGRCMQNMMLVAWNDGVASCPNGLPDPRAAAELLGLEGDLVPVTVLSFGYPRRPQDPRARSPQEWSHEANRKPLSELVQRM